MKRIAILLLACCLLLCACGAPDLPAAERPEATPVPETSIRGDYELLWSELEDSYPYLPYLKQKGIDVSGIRERYARELEDGSGTENLADLLRRMFRELGNFAHLNLVSQDLFQTYYGLFVSSDTFADLPEAAVFREVLTDPRVSPLYLVPEQGSGEGIDESNAPGPEPSSSWYPREKTLVIRIPSFDQRLVERDRTVVRDALDKHPEAEHIVFDITGNGGGSDWYWMENLVAPFGGAWDWSFRNYLHSSDTVSRFYGSEETLPTAELRDAPEWTATLGLDRYFESRVTLPEQAPNPDQAVETSARRWVLIDGGVYSSADKFACFCRSTGWATLVGTRTSGDGMGATPVLILLPESGLLVRFSVMAGENPDGSINAAAGTAPDLLSIRDVLPLNRCLEEIRGGL